MGKVGFDFGFRRTVLVMLVAVVWVLSLTSPYPGFAAHLPESCSFGGSLDVTRGAKGIGVASVDGEITATGRCDTSFDGTREEGADAELSAVYSTNDLSCGYQTELPATLRVGAHTTSIAIQPFKGGTVRVTAGASNASGELTAPNACEEGSSSIELGFSQPIPVDPSLATAALFGSIPVLPPIVAPQSEPVGSTARPTAQSPVFQSRFGRGGSEFFTGSETDSVRTAVSSRHLFVSSEAADSVYSFDADAPSTPLYSKSVSNPLGVTEYRDEVFVVSGSNFGRIYVYRESDLTTLRTISPRFADPVGQPSSEIKDVLAEQMTDIDAAWGELWISLRDGGTMVLDPQTGTVKSVHFGDPIPIHVEESDAGGATKAVTYLEMCLDWPGNDCEPPADAVAKQNGAGYWIWINPPRITTDWAAGETGQASDSLSEAWNDVSAVPEHNGVVQGAQFLTRSLLPDLSGSIPTCIGTVACGPLIADGFGEGTDAPWGMRWLSVVRDEADGDGGVLRRSTTVDEYRVEKTPSGQAAFSMARRWRTRCAYSGNVPTCGPSADIATRNRGTRIDWSGPLTEPEWIRGSYSLPYLVSDADVYVISKDGELYFEPARNFASIEMRVDNDLVSTATTAEGTFALDIDQRLANGAFRWASGTHTLSLIARLSDGTSVSRVNERFRIDHDSPTGGVSDPGRTVSGVTAINGSISDADSGPRDWRLQRSPAGQGAWSDICAAADPGPYSCSWDTRQVPDGRYSLRSTLRDRLSEPRGGPNSSTTSVVETIVDNTDPRLELSGWLRAAEDLRPLHDPNRYPLRIDASDSPGSGVRSIEILIDGVRAEFQEAPCELGGCAMQREFTFDPNGYSDGLHMVRVVVTDHAGRATVSEWQIDVEKVVPVPETETETAASASTPNALLGAVNFARSVNAASPEPDLLPCTQPNEAPNFGVYSLGASFEGLSLKALLRRCSVPYPEEGTRANFVSYIYGDCETPVEGDGWCTPPLEIQSWPSCERNITSYDLGPELGPMPYEPLEIQGVPAANIEIGQRIELYAGNTTIVIFGHDPNLVLRAAWAVKKEAAGQPPSPPSTTLPSNAGGGLPQPVAGVLDGTVHCLNSVSDLDELNAVPTHNYMAKRR